MTSLRKVEGLRPSKKLSLSNHDLNNVKKNIEYSRIPSESIQQSDFLNILEKEYEKVKRK